MNDENPLWLDNSIQFPRLLSEIMANGLTEDQWDGLLASMDLESDELSELFDRAQTAWEEAKERNLPSIATELEGAGWPDHAKAIREGVPLGTVIERLRNEHYPPDDLIEWLEDNQGGSAS